MDPQSLVANLRSWADSHRGAARAAGRRPGVKHPLLCVAMDFIREACGPVVSVVADRPVANVMASLNWLGWWKDEQERAESTAHLIAARDRALAGAAAVRVDFEELRAAPADVIRRLADELGLKVTAAQLEAAVQSVVKPADILRDVDPHQRFIDLSITARGETQLCRCATGVFVGRGLLPCGRFRQRAQVVCAAPRDG
jgi:hypothetical protein